MSLERRSSANIAVSTAVDTAPRLRLDEAAALSAPTFDVWPEVIRVALDQEDAGPQDVAVASYTHKPTTLRNRDGIRQERWGWWLSNSRLTTCTAVRPLEPFGDGKLRPCGGWTLHLVERHLGVSPVTSGHLAPVTVVADDRSTAGSSTGSTEMDVDAVVWSHLPRRLRATLVTAVPEADPSRETMVSDAAIYQMTVPNHSGARVIRDLWYLRASATHVACARGTLAASVTSDDAEHIEAALGASVWDMAAITAPIVRTARREISCRNLRPVEGRALSGAPSDRLGLNPAAR